MGSGHLLLARARASAGALVSTVVLLMVAVTSVTAVLAIGQAGTARGVRQALADLPPGSGVLTLQARLADDSRRQDAAVGEALASGGSSLIAWRSVSSGLLPVLQPATEGLRMVAAAYDDLPAHVTVVDGSWPAGATEVGTHHAAALHEAAARAAGVGVGDTLTVDGTDGPVRLHVAATWRPVEPGSAFFAGAPLETSGSESATVAGPLVVEDLAAAGLDVRPTLRWRVGVDAVGLDPGELAALAVAAERVAAAMRADPRLGAAAQVRDDLSGPLREVTAAARQARSSAAVPAVLLAALAAVVLVATARSAADRRAAETLLLRARGVSSWQRIALAVAEAAALAAPVAVAAVPAAWLLTEAVTGRAPAPADLAGTALAATLAGAALLLAGSLPVRRTGGGAAALAVPVGALAAAAVAVGQLRRYGGSPPGDAAAVDPLLVLAPALAVLAAVALAWLLVAPLARAARSAVSRRSALAPVLAASEVARRPSRHRAAFLLVALAVGAGVLTSAQHATGTASRRDAAVQQVGADIRVTGTGAPSGASRRDAYAGVDGVRAVTTAAVSAATASSTPVTMVALDASTAEESVRLPTGSTLDVASLTSALAPGGGAAPRDWPGMPLDAPDGGTVTVAVAADHRGEAAALPVGTRVSVTLWLGGRDGALLPVSVPPVDVGARPATEVPVDVPAGSRPWTLVALDASVPSLLGHPAAFTVRVTAATVQPGAADPGWRELHTAVPAAVVPPTVDTPGGPLPAVAVTTAGTGAEGQIRVRVGPDGLEPGPAAAVVDRRLAEAAGSRDGDVITLSRQGVATPLTVAGIVDDVPGTAGAAALVDLRALSASDLARGASPPAPDQWWIGLAPGADVEAVAAALREASGPATVRAAADIAARLAADPLAGGATPVLPVAGAASGLLLVAGLVVTAAAGSRRRAEEVAVLEAVGATSGQLRLAAAVEQAGVAVLAAAAGALAGWLAAAATARYLVAAAGAPGAVGDSGTLRLPPLLVLLVLGAAGLAVAAAAGVHQVRERRRPAAAAVRLGADR